MNTNEIAPLDLDLAADTIKAYAVTNNLTPQNVYDMFNIGINAFKTSGAIQPDADCLLAHLLAQELGLYIPQSNGG